MKTRAYKCDLIPTDRLSMASDGNHLKFSITGGAIFLNRRQCRDLAQQIAAWAGEEDKPTDIIGNSFL